MIPNVVVTPKSLPPGYGNMTDDEFSDLVINWVSPSDASARYPTAQLTSLAASYHIYDDLGNSIF